MPFTFTPLAIPEVILVETRIFEDSRGFFAEIYQDESFREAGIAERFVQDNYSFSRRGVLRGMHFQRTPYAQGKLVRVLKGGVWDVAVDLRRDAPTFGQWVGQELSEENRYAMWVPPGFAHGFVVLSDEAHFLYKCTAPYRPVSEGGFRWDDPDVGIEWPTDDIVLSERDAALPAFAKILP